MMLMDLAKRLIGMGLEEIELIILLAGLLGVVGLGEEVMARLCELHKMFKPAEQQKVFRFWINLIKDSGVHVDEILKILRACFHDILRSELVELATYPTVRNNKDFIKYLTETYDLKTLQVYGFDV